MSIFISIIIPIFNMESYLKECLESVIHQNIDECEVILVDDGSTDSSRDILTEYADYYNYIKVVYQSNQGVFLARNRGLLEAEGSYVLFLDADDYLLENSLAYLKKSIKNKDHDIIFFDLQLIGDRSFLKTKPYIPIVNEESNITKAMFLDNKSIAGYMGGKMIKKSIAEQAIDMIDHKNERIELYEDCLFLFCVSIFCKTALSIRKKMYIYRVHGNSATQKKITPKQKIEKLKTAELYFKALEETPILEANPYSKKILSKIIKVINSSILIQNAKQSNYIKNTHNAWLLDPRLINLARIIIYLVTFGRIKK